MNKYDSEAITKALEDLGFHSKSEVKEKMGKFNISKESDTKIERIPYNKEKVGHLTEQLMELSHAYNCMNKESPGSRIELEKAMKTINAAIEGELGSPNLIVSGDFFGKPIKTNMNWD